ncbi:hypothetical protein JCM8097_004816 [Rhodosporidiobolus ruineniae]
MPPQHPHASRHIHNGPHHLFLQPHLPDWQRQIAASTNPRYGLEWNERPELWIGSVDCLIACLAMDYLIEESKKSRRANEKFEHRWTASGGVATYAYTRKYLPSIPNFMHSPDDSDRGVPVPSSRTMPPKVDDITSRLADFNMGRHTNDCDVDVDTKHPFDEMKKLDGRKVNAKHGGEHIFIDGAGSGEFRVKLAGEIEGMTARKGRGACDWIRHEPYKGDVPFDLHGQSDWGGFSTEPLWPGLNAFHPLLSQQVEIHDDDGRLAGQIWARTPLAIVLRKLYIYPRRGGPEGKRFKDLVDINKLFTVHAHEVALKQKHNPNFVPTVDLDPASPNIQRLLRDLAAKCPKADEVEPEWVGKPMRAYLLHKAKVLHQDREAALSVATYELSVVQEHIHGHQSEEVVAKTHLSNIRKFGPEEHNKLADRYQWSFGELVKLLEHGMTAHSLSKSEYWPRARAEFAGMGAASSGGAGW